MILVRSVTGKLHVVSRQHVPGGGWCLCRKLRFVPGKYKHGRDWVGLDEPVAQLEKLGTTFAKGCASVMDKYCRKWRVLRRNVDSVD